VSGVIQGGVLSGELGQGVGSTRGHLFSRELSGEFGRLSELLDRDQFTLFLFEFERLLLFSRLDIFFFILFKSLSE